MAFRVINRPQSVQQTQQPYTSESALEGIGRGFGTGLTDVLNSLADAKINQLKDYYGYNPASSRLQNLGLNRAESDYLATLPPKEQLQLIDMIGSGSSLGQRPQIASGIQQGQQIRAPMANQQSVSQGEIEPESSFLQKIGESGRRAAQFKEMGEQNKEMRKARIKEQHEMAKESRQVYKDSIKAGHAAKDLDAHLDRMQKLVEKEGGLPIAAFRKLFKKIESAHVPHIPFLEPIVQGVGSILLSTQEGLTSPNTAEFEKLSTDLIRGAKEIFGSRVTDADLNTFLKTIPSLDQTDASKLRVIKNMRTFNRAGKLKAEAARRIIRENNGMIPYDIEQQIEEEVGIKLDKLYKDFIEDVEESTPQTGANLLPFTPINSQLRQL